MLFHLLAVIILVLGVCSELDLRIPGIDMPFLTTVIGQIAGRT